ncbi:uncharacterized protein IL334_003492 [Kwoniella shivajii]|uniref:Solute carrier family 25 (Peroxisomal adenine nucleotide transporter), member 17 n=1 Tax=Kwoniella shivajii TaxID=564305 RepID=A0ABZ1CXQ5_9TREE|nr:hypothetical protein IL334_003492 [Kwoniella shivajii]
MNSTLPPFLQATSGALGSAVGNAIVYPLDLATTRMQHNARKPHSERLNLGETLSHLLSKRDYMTRLYSGLEADTISTLLSNFLYFYTYTSLQKGLHVYHSNHPSLPSTTSTATNGNGTGNGSIRSSPAGIGGLNSKASDILPQIQKTSGIEELLIGILSGLISKGISLPISTVCVKQQIESEHEHEHEHEHETDNKNKNIKLSLYQTLRLIHKESGVQGLFSGLKPTIPLTLLPSLTLYIHSVLVRLILSKTKYKNQTHPPAIITFLLGALSNALATLPLYPLVLIKVLSQSGGGNDDKGKGKSNQVQQRKAGMLNTLLRIIRRGGIRTLYTGLEGQLVKGLVQQGVMMLVKQRVEQCVIKAYKARSHAVKV